MSGEYIRKLDENGRLMLPFSIRTLLLKRRNKRWCLLWKSSELPALCFYPLSEWEFFQEDIREKAGEERFPQALAQSGQLKVDKKGRILLKINLRQHLKLGTARKVVVVGMFESFEVWGVAQWQQRIHDASVAK